MLIPTSQNRSNVSLQGSVRDADGLERLQARLHPRPNLLRKDDHRQDAVSQARETSGEQFLWALIFPKNSYSPRKHF